MSAEVLSESAPKNHIFPVLKNVTRVVVNGFRLRKTLRARIFADLNSKLARKVLRAKKNDSIALSVTIARCQKNGTIYTLQIEPS